MTRPLDPATSTALGNTILPLAFIVYLDIKDDPFYAWTGIGDLPFAGGATGDPSLDGNTFYGLGTVAEIGTISDGAGGSDALIVKLPGVDLNDVILKQILTDRRRWQFRRAIVWAMLLDEVTGAIVGKPFRVKTGRMDQMPFGEDKGVGYVSCKIEGQQAYGNEPLETRYAENALINPNDNSQRYVYSLANMTAGLGKNSIPSGGQTSGGTGIGGTVVTGGGGGGGGGPDGGLNHVDKF